MDKYCTNCGAAHAEGVKFCAECGQETVSNTSVVEKSDDFQEPRNPTPTAKKSFVGIIKGYCIEVVSLFKNNWKQLISVIAVTAMIFFLLGTVITNDSNSAGLASGKHTESTSGNESGISYAVEAGYSYGTYSYYNSIADRTGSIGDKIYIDGFVVSLDERVFTTGRDESVNFYTLSIGKVADNGKVDANKWTVMCLLPDDELDVEVGDEICLMAYYMGYSAEDLAPCVTYLEVYVNGKHKISNALSILGYDKIKSIVTDSEESDSNTTTTTNATTTTNTTTTTAAPVTEYYSGMYKVSVDIPAGAYILYPNSSSISAYMCISSDSNQDDIIDNDNFDGQVYVQIESGQYFELNRGYAIPYSMTEPLSAIGALSDGMYKVGRDIPAGEYKVNASSERYSGYWCIYSKPLGKGCEIISNDNFKSSTYVTVRDGQYLYISRGEIVVR